LLKRPAGARSSNAQHQPSEVAESRERRETFTPGATFTRRSDGYNGKSCAAGRAKRLALFWGSFSRDFPRVSTPDAFEKVRGARTTRNNRIEGTDFLNRNCMFAGLFESILLRAPLKILFQQHPPIIGHPEHAGLLLSCAMCGRLRVGKDNLHVAGSHGLCGFRPECASLLLARKAALPISLGPLGSFWAAFWSAHSLNGKPRDVTGAPPSKSCVISQSALAAPEHRSGMIAQIMTP
jgi:hypothetical protein